MSKSNEIVPSPKFVCCKKCSAAQRTPYESATYHFGELHSTKLYVLLVTAALFLAVIMYTMLVIEYFG